MRLFFHSLLHSIILRKELAQSAWGHFFLFIAVGLFMIIAPHATFRNEKFVSVNLTNFGPRVAGLPPGPKKAAQGPVKTVPKISTPPQAVKKEAPPKATPKPEIKKTAPPQAQQKVQKLTPKPVAPKVIAPVKSKVTTPSLSDRLKNRLGKVKTTPTQKFVEPQKLDSKPLKAATNTRFVEPGEWSTKAKVRSSGAQTQLSAVTAGGGGSGKEFPFSWYLDLIQNKITMNWKEPPKPLLSSGDLSAIVSFTINRNGQIQGIRISGKSSLEILNKSVIEAVEYSNPLPPLPDDYPENQLNVKIKFELKQ